MAKCFYTAEETQDKLKINETQLKRLVSEGELRQFRDAGEANFKVEDVDDLADSDILKIMDSVNCKDVSELEKEKHVRQVLPQITDLFLKDVADQVARGERELKAFLIRAFVALTVILIGVSILGIVLTSR